MEILFLSHSYKTIHQVLVEGINECLEKNECRVSNEFNPAVNYDCIFVFNRKALAQYEEMLQTVKVPVIYMFCMSDFVKEYCTSDTITHTIVFKDKILNTEHLLSTPLIYQDMLLPAHKIHPHAGNNNESDLSKKAPVIYVNIDDEYFGDLIFFKILPFLNLLYNYEIYYRSTKGIGRQLMNKHIKLVRPQQNMEDWLDKSDIVIASGLVAYKAVQRAKKTIVIGEKGYGGLVTGSNLEYHLSNFFQGRSGGKFDEPIPPQLLLRAITTEMPDTQKMINGLSFLQAKKEEKFISLIEKAASFTPNIDSDEMNASYMLNPNYAITEKKPRRYLSKRGFNKLYQSINESEATVILTFREPHTLSEALNAFPPEYTEDIKEYIHELIEKKILIPYFTDVAGDNRIAEKQWFQNC